MTQLLMISRLFSWFTTMIGKTAAWLFLPMIAIIIVDVISRKFGLLIVARNYFTDAGQLATADFIRTYLTSTKFQEMEWHLHAALFLLCLGFGYARNAHVRIEVVRERFPTRVKAWLELVGCTVFLLPYAFVVLYYGIDFAERAFDNNEVSSALTGLSHRWIIKSFVPLGMIILFIATLGVVLRNIVYLFGTDDDAKRAYEMAPELHTPEEEMRQLKLAAEAEIKGK